MMIQHNTLGLFVFLFLSLAIPCVSTEKNTQWSIQEIQLTAKNDYPWWEFPAKAVFTHESGKQYTINAYWNGDKNWIVRYTPTLPAIFASAQPGGSLSMQTERRCCSWGILCGLSTRRAAD